MFSPGIIQYGGGGPAPTTYFYDTFVDANSTPLPSHTPNIDVSTGGWTTRPNGLSGNTDNPTTIQSNATLSPPNTVYSISTFNATVADGTFICQIDVPSATSYAPGFVFRYGGTASFSAIIIERDAGGAPYMSVFNRNSGTTTVLGSTTFASDPTGTSITLTIGLNGSSVMTTSSTGDTLSVTDTLNVTAVDHGIFGYVDGVFYNSPTISHSMKFTS